MYFNEFPNKFFSDSGSGSILTRDKIEEKYKWDLTHIYESDEKWEEDFKWVEKNINRYKEFEGKLSKDCNLLLSCLKFDDSIGIVIDRLHLYASLSKDSDMKVQIYQSMDERMRNLISKVSSAGSFLRPEILSIPNDELLKCI